ncbi:MAG: ribosomal protein S18-alanine N-acetyltransferase [bacterium]|nr:ribosomal protein S18-alanine N-acetyltransferase [bacterium]
MIKEVEFKPPFSYTVEYIKDNKTVGTLSYSLIYDRMELDNIEVKKEYRNKHIGTKLMSYLVSIAIEKHVVNITLEVRQSNAIAISLYKKFGFREVALRKNYYEKENGILMEKQVM